jgi:hypothetical protein
VIIVSEKPGAETGLPVTPGMRRVRVGLVGLGILLLIVGGITLVNDVGSPKSYAGIALWMLGALVIHDGIISLGVFGASVVMRRLGGTLRVPLPVILIVQGALVVGGIMALVVVPEIMKKSIGTANPTLLPLDYGLHLAVFYAVLVPLTVVAIAAYLLLTRRARHRRAASRPSPR